jgi:hypothetical protein
MGGLDQPGHGIGVVGELGDHRRLVEGERVVGERLSGGLVGAHVQRGLDPGPLGADLLGDGRGAETEDGELFVRRRPVGLADACPLVVLDDLLDDAVDLRGFQGLVLGLGHERGDGRPLGFDRAEGAALAPDEFHPSLVLAVSDPVRHDRVEDAVLLDGVDEVVCQLCVGADVLPDDDVLRVDLDDLFVLHVGLPPSQLCRAVGGCSVPLTVGVAGSRAVEARNQGSAQPIAQRRHDVFGLMR